MKLSGEKDSTTFVPITLTLVLECEEDASKFYDFANEVAPLAVFREYMTLYDPLKGENDDES